MVKKLTVEEVLSIYNYCVLMGKETYHIKYAFLKYKGLKELTQKTLWGEELLFSSENSQR